MPISATILRQSRSQQQSNCIAFCVDDNYLPYALFVATQLLQKQTLPIDICICLPNMDNVPVSFKSLEIRLVEIQITGIDSLPTDHLSLAAYHRLFLPQLFANEYNYIIYLDADIYIKRPFLEDLYELINGFEDDFCVAAAPYMGEAELLTFGRLKNAAIERYIERYHRLAHLYRNSGVLVFNVANYNQQRILDKIIETLISHPDQLESHDQSALNLTLLNDLALLPIIYNWQLNHFSATVIDEFDPYIVHFVNVNKPWAVVKPYLAPYVSAYEAFLTQHFPELGFKPLTDDEKRKQNPKYRGVKELISSRWSTIKSSKRYQSQGQKYQQYKPQIVAAIKQISKGRFHGKNT